MTTSIKNTDRELWRERDGDHYANSIHVTKAGGIGINCGGRVIVKSLKAWHELGMFESEVDAITAQPMSRGEAEVIAGRVAAADKIADLQARVVEAVKKLEDIVCVAEPDRGVVLLSYDGPTHYDPAAKCQVYDHQNFSPLGDALIALHDLLSGKPLTPGATT